MGVEECLANADHVGSNQRLIDHFRVLPTAGRTLVNDRFSNGLEQRLPSLARRLIAPQHDRERRSSRSDIAA